MLLSAVRAARRAGLYQRAPAPASPSALPVAGRRAARLPRSACGGARTCRDRSRCASSASAGSAAVPPAVRRPPAPASPASPASRRRGRRVRVASWCSASPLGAADRGAARARVAAVERARDERLLGSGKASQNLPLMCDMYSPQIIAGYVPPSTLAAEEEAVHVDAAVGVADPHRRGQARREADEPGVGVVVRRPGLAGGRAADLRRARRCRRSCSAGGSRSPWRSRRRRRPSSASRGTAGAATCPAPRAVGEHDALDRRRADAVAAARRSSRRPSPSRAARRRSPGRRASRPGSR